MTQATAPLHKIDASPYHHRAHFGDMAGLTASIVVDGIIHPLVVREKNKRWELICGERRRRAAEKAGLKDVPITIREGLTDEDVIRIQATENLARQDLHPLDEAGYYSDLIDQGLDVAAIAKTFRRKKQDVTRAIKLLALGPPARKAFVDGMFDLAAALAIARVADPGKQKDILAAVDAGSLQSEEIESYVERTYTNALADAAWNMHDADLVRAAGACSGCPKRSGAQRDLFDDAQSDRCLDVDCWSSKMHAAYELLATRTTGDTPELMLADVDPRAVFMPSGAKPAVLRSSGYVDSEATCPHLNGHTWVEAISKSQSEPPTLYLIRDPAGRPRMIYRETAAARVVRKSDAAAAEAKARETADPVREGGQASKLRRAVVERLAALGVERDADAMVWIARRLIDMASKRAVAHAAAQFGVEPVALSALIESNRKAKHVAIAILVREVADVAGELPPALAEFAELAGTSLEEIESMVRGAS